MFPIGSNIFGDHVLICVASENNGAIFFRRHDTPKKYTKLTDTFKEFVMGCKSKKAPKVRSIEERIAGRIAHGIMEPPLPIDLGQYRTIRQERMARKFGSAKRHFFAGILDVFQEKVTHLRPKFSASRRRRHCAVLP